MFFAAMALIAAAPSTPARAADAKNGEALARQWCAGCHVVDDKATGARTDMTPSFPSIARRPQFSDAELRAWLRTPHPNMPNFDLSRATVEDLVAYIQSLAAPGR
jgi:mono/diheme cytochrome c family protein